MLDVAREQLFLRDEHLETRVVNAPRPRSWSRRCRHDALSQPAVGVL